MTHRATGLTLLAIGTVAAVVAAAIVGGRVDTTLGFLLAEGALWVVGSSVYSRLKRQGG